MGSPPVRGRELKANRRRRAAGNVAVRSYTGRELKLGVGGAAQNLY